MTEQPWQRRQLAGFWLRVAAVLVDAVVAVVAFAALVLLASPVLETLTGETPDTVVVVSIAGGVLALAVVLYDVLMTAGAGGTLGKRATGVEVRTADGQRVEVGRALGRSLARLLSIVIVLLGLLWITWDRRKQGWHDKLAGTMVVKRRHLPLSLRDPEAPWWATAAPAALPAGTPIAAEEAPAATQELGWTADAAGAASAGGVWAAGGDEPVDTRWAPSPTDAGDAEPATAHAVAGADPPAAATQPDQSDAAQPSAMGGTADDDALAASGFFADDQVSGSALDDAEPDGAAAGGPAAAGAPGGPPGAGPPGEPAPARAPETSAFRELFDDEPAQARAVDEADSAASGPGGADPNWGGPGDTDTGTATAAGATAGTGAGAAGVAAQEPAAAAPAGDGAEETDPNLVAIHRAGLADDAAGWLEQVAAQVDPRLDQVSTAWRQQEQALAARACAFGLLLGHLATLYPHMADDLHRVAEAHPSFSTLTAGSRLTTLQQIADDPERTAAWLGPLMGVRDQERVARLLQ